MTGSHTRTTIAWLFGAGVVVRLLYLVELSTLPAWVHARGDELYYLEAATLWATQGACEPFHMSPLYVTWLSWVRGLLGEGPLVWRLPQVVMGLGSAWMLADVARRRGGENAGVWVAGLYLFCGPLIFYESNLAVATFASTTMVAALFCLQRWIDLEEPAAASRAGLRWWLLGAFAVGVGITARPNALLLLGPIVLLPWLRRPGMTFRSRVLLTLLAPMVALAVTAPVTVHNARCGDELVWITDTGGLNLYVGNHSSANGVFNVPPRVEGARSVSTQDQAFIDAAQRALGRDLSRSEASRYWRDEALREIAEDPARWLALLLTKLALVFNAEEFSNTRSYSFREELMLTLGPWLIQVGYLVPFSLVGFGVWLRHPTRHVVPLGFAAAYVTAHVAFFVLGHYRQVLLPLFILAAVDGGRWLLAQVRARRTAPATLGLGVALAGAIGSHWPILETSRADEAFKHGYALHRAGNLTGAERWYREALAEHDDHRQARRNLAILYSRTGRHDDAAILWRAILADARQNGDDRRAVEAQHFLDAALN